MILYSKELIKIKRNQRGNSDMDGEEEREKGESVNVSINKGVEENNQLA